MREVHSRSEDPTIATQPATLPDTTGKTGPARREQPSGARSSRAQAMRLAHEERQWLELMPHLPESVQVLYQALGNMRHLWRLLQSFGGQSLRVPQRMPAADHPLRRCLGRPCLQKLMAFSGGTSVYVPRCEALQGRLRQREIIEAFSASCAQGVSSTAAVAALARRFALSDRRIWQILKKEASVPPQARALRRLAQNDALAQAAVTDRD